MYEGHFQLERRPFAATPDPSCCYLAPTMQSQFQNVVACIEQGRGIAILTGPAGIGKTLLSQVLLVELQPQFTGVYLGTGQFATRRAFLQAILYELGQPYGGMSDQELRLELTTSLKNLIQQNDGLLLILDEAHLLSDRLLEEVRLLADLSQLGIPLIRVVLFGNPEFEERLTSPSLSAFNQRVGCHESIETLLRAESVAYLTYRIQWAGREANDIFEPGALELIAEASDGVPRCLNQLADHSLAQAFHAGEPIVRQSTVRESLAMLQSLPLRWNASSLLGRSWVAKSEPESPNSDFTPRDILGESRSPESIEHAQAHKKNDGQPGLSRDRDDHDDVQITFEQHGVDGDPESSSFEFGAGDFAASHNAVPIVTNRSADTELTAAEAVSSTFADSSGPETGNSSASRDPQIDHSGASQRQGTHPLGFNLTLSRPPASLESSQVQVDPPFNDSELILSDHELTEELLEEDVDVVVASPRFARPIPRQDCVEEQSTQRESNDEEEDANRPVFSWLQNPAKHSEPDSSIEAVTRLTDFPSSGRSAVAKGTLRSLAKSPDQEVPSSDRPLSREGRGTTVGIFDENDVRRQTLMLRSENEQSIHVGQSQSAISDAEDAFVTVEEPAEEVIVDRYATLDAQVRSQRPWPPARTSSPSRSLKITQSDLDKQSAPTTISKSAADSVIAQGVPPKTSPEPIATPSQTVPEPQTPSPLPQHPVDQIDSICALLEIVEESSHGATGVELVTDWGVERIDIDLPSATDPTLLADPGLHSTSDPSFDLRTFLGGAVFDVGRDLLPANQVPASEAFATPSSDSHSGLSPVDSNPLHHENPELRSATNRLERMTQFDIVEPDHPANEAVESQLNGPSTGEPALRNDVTRIDFKSNSEDEEDQPLKRFSNLFSSLRRRKPFSKSTDR